MPKPSKARRIALQREETRRLEREINLDTPSQLTESPVVETKVFQPRGNSRTSKWRDENQKTKKSRAARMQPSVLKFFSPIGVHKGIRIENGNEGRTNGSIPEVSEVGTSATPMRDPQPAVCDNEGFVSDTPGVDISEINTDTEDGGRAGTQPSLVSATEVDRSIEAAGGLRQPSQSVTEVPRNLENGMKAKANDLNDKLAANEQMYQGIMKAYTNNLAGDEFECRD